jgi:hypothetical protein
LKRLLLRRSLDYDCVFRASHCGTADLILEANGYFRIFDHGVTILGTQLEDLGRDTIAQGVTLTFGCIDSNSHLPKLRH